MARIKLREALARLLIRAVGSSRNGRRRLNGWTLVLKVVPQSLCVASRLAGVYNAVPGPNQTTLFAQILSNVNRRIDFDQPA